MTTAPIKPSRARRVCMWTGPTLSLLLAAAWGASGWRSDIFGHDICGCYMLVLSTRGEFGLTWTSDKTAAGMLNDVVHGNVIVHRLAGTIHETLSQRLIGRWPQWRRGSGLWTLTAPYWIPFPLVASASSVLWLRCRTRKPGQCGACGYDLAGLPFSALCPECGAARPENPATVPPDAR